MNSENVAVPGGLGRPIGVERAARRANDRVETLILPLLSVPPVVVVDGQKITTFG